VVPESTRVGFNWRITLVAAACSFVLITPALFYEPDVSIMGYALFAVPATFLLAVLAIWKKGKRTQIFTALATFWLVSIPLLANYMTVRTTFRWIVVSHSIKKKVLAEPLPSDGELRHVDWDGWGMFSLNTSAFVVFDPTNSLSAAAKNHERGRFPGIPCEVARVRRLENQWYAVEFYTGGEWGPCD
jgi:hypothetical protein